MGILIAFTCTFPQESTPGIILGVFTFCAPGLLVTFKLPYGLLGICFGDPVISEAVLTSGPAGGSSASSSARERYEALRTTVRARESAAALSGGGSS